MKLMIASDIHGSAYWCKKMLEAFEQNGAEKLILLGDILYHGPRNDLPKEYAPKQVIAMLNPLKNKLLCVRGNCDTEVDQMVLDFPVMAEYAYICCDGLRIFATHGHKFNCDNLPPLSKGDILLHGHVRKQRIILKKITDFPFLWLQKNLFSGIKKGNSVNHDPPFFRSFDPGNTFQGQAFPTSGSAQDSDPLFFTFKGNIQPEFSILFFYL